MRNIDICVTSGRSQYCALRNGAQEALMVAKKFIALSLQIISSCLCTL